MSLVDTLWVEKYRPRSLDEMVLPSAMRDSLIQFVEQNDVPHLLLVGITGSGKTTIAKILIDSCDCGVLRLNASDDRGIDVVRTRIKSFLQAQGVHRWKFVFLDECDNMTMDAQFCLRNMMERFSKVGRFILTANDESRIHEAVRSRCATFYFAALDKKHVSRHLKKILDAEEVEYSPADMLALIQDYYPDVRKIINMAQAMTVKGKLTYQKPESVEMKVLDLVKAKDLRTLRETVIANKPNFTDLYRMLFDAVVGHQESPRLEMTVQLRGQAAVVVAEHMYRDAIVPDREVNFAACAIELMGMLS